MSILTGPSTADDEGTQTSPIVDWRLGFLLINLSILSLTWGAIDVSTSPLLVLDEQGVVLFVAIAAGLFIPTAAQTCSEWFSNLFGTQANQSDSSDGERSAFAVVDWRLVMLSINFALLGTALTLIDMSMILSVGIDERGITFVAAVAGGLLIPIVALLLARRYTNLFDSDDPLDRTDPDYDDSDDDDWGDIDRDSGETLPERDEANAATKGGFAVEGWGDDDTSADLQPEDGSMEQTTSASEVMESGDEGGQAVSTPSEGHTNQNRGTEENQNQIQQQSISPNQTDDPDVPTMDKELLESSRNSSADDDTAKPMDDEDNELDGLRESEVKYQQHRDPY